MDHTHRQKRKVYLKKKDKKGYYRKRPSVWKEESSNRVTSLLEDIKCELHPPLFRPSASAKGDGMAVTLETNRVYIEKLVAAAEIQAKKRL